MICKKCNGEIDKKAVVCVHCGCKVKKPIYKKWWAWTILALLLIIIISSSGGDGTTTTTSTANDTTNSASEVISYEVVDLSVMINELKSNALKAKDTYKGKQIEFTAKISNFDSSGKYISVEPANADEWNFDTVMCYIKNEEQKSLLLEKNTDDIITIRGKVKSIGEVMGYSIDIAEVE